MSHYINNLTLPLFETFCRKTQVDGKTIEAKIGDNTLLLKVATTPASQAQGYMGAKESPNENEGIMFVYDEPMPLSFWMKNVNFPLDIMFFDSEMQCVGYETMDPYRGEPDTAIKHYISKKPARFAVEVMAGWCSKNFKEGATLSF